MEHTHEDMKNNFVHLIENSGDAVQKVHGQIGLLLLELVEGQSRRLAGPSCDGNCNNCACDTKNNNKNNNSCDGDCSNCDCDKSESIMVETPKRRSGRPKKTETQVFTESKPTHRYTTVQDI